MADEDLKESADTYKISDQSVKKVDALMDLDKDDESLKKWKATLLGSAVKAYSPKDDPRRVVIVKMAIIIEGREDIVYTFDNKEQVEKLKDSPFTLREGCNYKMKLSFIVQHELVTGLKHVNTITRKGLRMAKDEMMIGSFGPQETPYVFVMPRQGWEETPKGMLARGNYKANSKFVDDDNVIHLEYDYAFAIKKEWDSKDED